jgi:hypothetical protein
MEEPTCGELFLCKPVRDLWWAIASPSILDASGAIAVLPDAWCAQLVERSLPWLRALDRQPEALIEWLAAQRNVSRLGFYFACLLEYWVRFCPLLAETSGEPKVLTQQQIHVGLAGEVAGQLKCVFQRRASSADEPAELLHWESHVKYFAFVSPDDPMLPPGTDPSRVHPIRSKSGRPLTLAPPPQAPPSAPPPSDRKEPDLAHPPWRRALIDTGVEPGEAELAEYVGPFLGENLLQRCGARPRRAARATRQWSLRVAGLRLQCSLRVAELALSPSRTVRSRCGAS